MNTPLPQLLAQVGAMNDLASPFVFSPRGEGIVGSWDASHADYDALVAACELDEGYRLEVRLHAEAGTYELAEHSTTGWSAGAGAVRVEAPVPVGIGGGPLVGSAVLSPDGVVTLAPCSLDTTGIRDSLVMFLESHGWTRRRGFFARLFG